MFITLVPIVLYHQFRVFSNLFFLFIAISQLIPALNIGPISTVVTPLLIVLAITIIKESVDDYKRYKRDIEVNSQKFKKVTEEGLIDIESKDIKVGDLIHLSANERIPADMILLYTSDKSRSVFLRTDQLDGETDWKLRKPVGITQEMGDMLSIAALEDNAYVIAEPPNKQIYAFKGNAFIHKGGDIKKEPLSLEQTMWANTVLASATAVGIVIYTGKETRAQKNSSDPSPKFGAIDNELNIICKILFGFMFVCAFVIVAMDDYTDVTTSMIHIFRFIMLLSPIIPISLRVNLDFAKIVYSYRISNDPNIPETIARNSTIPEELGRIQYLFTDKTGTLTQNEMIFKQICFEAGTYDEEGLGEMRTILKEECAKVNGPMKDLEEDVHKDKEAKKKTRRNKANVVRDALTALSICHNVTPVYEESGKVYQASSPDEVALVKIADSLNMVLNERSQTKIQLMNAAGEIEDYEILANFPFSSETKRMGILVRHSESQRLIFYLKGAEVVMEAKVNETSRHYLRETCENLASTGLRTLVISQKYVTEDEYKSWVVKYNNAKAEMENREIKVQRVVDELERGMEFLCVTGVEDKLQLDVTDTIESLRNGGVQIWMLTGDKVETATCIAISTGLKSKTQHLYFMKELSSKETVEHKLKDYAKLKDTVLVIDGNTLQVALDNLNQLFFKVASKV
jgi:phospholipid-translocating ATPase